VSVARGDFSGLFHLCGQNSYSFLELSSLLVGSLNKCDLPNPLITACLTTDLNFLETRPTDTAMDPSKFLAEAGASFESMEEVCDRLAKRLAIWMMNIGRNRWMKP